MLDEFDFMCTWEDSNGFHEYPSRVMARSPTCKRMSSHTSLTYAATTEPICLTANALMISPMPWSSAQIPAKMSSV